MNQIQKTVELRAPVEQVWKAVVNFREFGAWFLVNVDAPFRAGEISTGHMTHPGYEHVQWNVEIQQIEPMKLFSFTWHPYAVAPNIDYSLEKSTLVEFCFEPTSLGTRLTIVESGFDALPTERALEALRMNESGWSQQIKNIRQYLE